MSIQEEITRLNNAKSAIKTAIEGKGVAVSSNTKIDGMASLIDSIDNGLTVDDVNIGTVSASSTGALSIMVTDPAGDFDWKIYTPTNGLVLPENIVSGKTVLGISGTGGAGSSSGPIGKDVEWVLLSIGPSWEAKEISGCLFAGTWANPISLTTANVTNYQPCFHTYYDLPSDWYSNSNYNSIFVPKNSFITIWALSTVAEPNYSTSSCLTSYTGTSVGNFQKQTAYTNAGIYYGYTYKVMGSGVI